MTLHYPAPGRTASRRSTHEQYINWLGRIIPWLQNPLTGPGHDPRDSEVFLHYRGFVMRQVEVLSNPADQDPAADFHYYVGMVYAAVVGVDIDSLAAVLAALRQLDHLLDLLSNPAYPVEYIEANLPNLAEQLSALQAELQSQYDSLYRSDS